MFEHLLENVKHSAMYNLFLTHSRQFVKSVIIEKWFQTNLKKINFSYYIMNVVLKYMEGK